MADVLDSTSRLAEPAGGPVAVLLPIRAYILGRREVTWGRAVATAAVSLALLTALVVAVHLAEASANPRAIRFLPLGGAGWPTRALYYARQEWPGLLVRALLPRMVLIGLFLSFPFGYAERYLYRWTDGQRPRGRREVVLAVKYTLLGFQTWLFAAPLGLVLQGAIAGWGRYGLGRAAEVLGLVALLAVLCLTVWLLARQVARAVLTALDESYCHRCGYLLTHLSDPRCPECGQPFDPARVGRS